MSVPHKPTRAERMHELESRLKTLEREHKDTEQVMSDMGARRKQVEIDIKQIRNQLAQMKPKDVTISEHALIRYIEREHGIDVEAYRKEMLAKVGGLADMGTVKAAGFVIKDNTVITYIKNEGDKH